MVDIKSSSNAVWWIKKPKEHKRRTQSMDTKLCQDMTDLFSNISLHGYNKLLDSEMFLYEKLIWLCALLTTFIALITVMSYTWEKFVLQTFAINLHDPLYPIENIPFPAVSICSNNRISRMAAENYAKVLSSEDPRNRSREYFLPRILYFHSLYYKYERSDNFTEFENFQAYLDRYRTEDKLKYYNILKIMNWLTPKCSDLIVKCTLSGKEIDCFHENAFQNGLTMYGQCCTFNANNSYRKRNVSHSFITSDLGLTVILNTTHIDDTVPLLNIDGYVVIIHNPNDFPDISSGNSLEVFPMNNEESFIAIKAKFMDTGEELRTFNPSYRKCYFDDEAPDRALLLRNSYTFTNCITRCRIRSVIALCQCVPFYMPLELMDNVEIPYCTLKNIGCMQLYNFKWRNVLTQRVSILGLERETEEALYCPQCLPSCDDTQYDISMMSLPTDRFWVRENIGDDYNLKMEDTSVLRVYFGEPTALYYRRVISNTWVEALSTVGNIVSIFVGFSMVALLEILYFILKYLFVAGQKFMHQDMYSTSIRGRKGVKKVKSATKLYILP